MTAALLLDALRVQPGEAADLSARSTRDVPGLDLEKPAAARLLESLAVQVGLLAQRLYAEASRSVLLVLQGTDTSGKDGAIKGALDGVSPSSLRVVAFKGPSDSELDHDPLWRIHASCPNRGEIGVFNRSHYEDVVAVRVRGLVPESRWRPRFAHLRDFESMLSAEGTTVVKCFLHLSSEEQRARLQARLDDPEKRWKFRSADLEDRQHWDDFTAAYEEAITETSIPEAPWWIVPADRKWLRNLVVAQLLVDTLVAMDPQLPPGEPGTEGLVVS